MPDAYQPAPNTQHPTPDTNPKTPNTKHPTPTQNTQHAKQQPFSRHTVFLHINYTRDRIRRTQVSQLHTFLYFTHLQHINRTHHTPKTAAHIAHTLHKFSAAPESAIFLHTKRRFAHAFLLFFLFLNNLKI